MKKECRNCQHWKSPSISDFGNCRKIAVGKDVRIGNRLLQTSSNFGCKYFKKKEVSNV